MSEKNEEITKLLQRVKDGDTVAENDLMTLVYPILRKLASAHRVKWSGDHTMSTTAIINEAYLKLVRSSNQNWNDRIHFFRVCSKAMRQILLTYREKKMAQKRGSGELAEEFKDSDYAAFSSAEHIAALEQELVALENEHPRAARVFECRRVGGLSVDEIAEVLSVSQSTVKREFKFAEVWLYSRIMADAD